MGLLAAMPEELGEITKNLDNLKSKKFGDFEIFTGEWTNDFNKKILISVAWSGWGKVNAAYAATRIINEAEKKNHKLDLLIFTGVAGAIDKSLNGKILALKKKTINEINSLEKRLIKEEKRNHQKKQ